jgi:hypothetical protein
MVSTHTCQIDSQPCTAITQLHLDGAVRRTIVETNFFAGFDDPLLVDSNILIISGHKLDSLEPLRLSTVDLTTGESEVSDVITDVEFEIVNNGFKRIIGRSVYSYGSVYLPLANSYSGYVSKWNMTLDTILKTLIFDPSEIGTGVFDLQSSPNEDLYFTSSFNQVAGRFDHAIVKLKIDDDVPQIVYTYSDFASLSPTLLLDSTGNCYFGSRQHPELVFPVSFGRINKLGKESSLLWSVELPSDPFTNEREYVVNDIIQAADRNILACGTVIDRDSLGLAETGFIVNITEYGEINWLRIFKLPNSIEPEIRGYYQQSSLRKINLDSDGQIAAYGYSVRFNMTGSPELLLWLVSLDTNGCISPIECEEVIIVTSIKKPLADPKKTVYVYPNPVHDVLHLSTQESLLYEIWSSSGELVNSGRVQGHIDIAGYLPGMYLLRLVTRRNVELIKFVKSE